ncbi:MAG: RagB/SusD family nutrient uptake outer membrane protein [Bacteroidota bacterium]|nr:RagB/SusD family nutrient uptake outer membrane protein [Bacteroidota bacterium]
MKKTRYFIGISLLALTLVLNSCGSFFDEKSNGNISAETAITDAGTARAAIIGAYDEVQNYYSSYTTLGTITADNVVFNGSLSQYLQLDQISIPVDNVVTVAAYQGIYQAINSANTIISLVPSVSDPALTTTEKNKILGEAYFIRALGYFDLGRGWGGVQLRLTPTKDIASLKGVKRSTLDQTYDQVLSDLIKAEQLLPDVTASDSNLRNRAQKASVRALRARLHLYRQQWSDAENYASQVIAETTKYNLVTPYKAFFTAPYLTSESVLELTFSTNDKNSFWNLWYLSNLGGQYTLKPSDSFVTKVKDPTIGGSRSTLVAGTSPNVYGVLYNSTAGADPFYLIRIAELYLIRAEARAQQNNLTGALSDLNVVRNRAGLVNSTATTQVDILTAIENENNIEFAFEAHRWFDLVRTKRVGAVLGVTNTNLWLFPIPGSDILSDPDVTQNPGY